LGAVAGELGDFVTQAVLDGVAVVVVAPVVGRSLIQCSPSPPLIWRHCRTSSRPSMTSCRLRPRGGSCLRTIPAPARWSWQGSIKELMLCGSR